MTSFLNGLSALYPIRIEELIRVSPSISRQLDESIIDSKPQHSHLDRTIQYPSPSMSEPNSVEEEEKEEEKNSTCMEGKESKMSTSRKEKRKAMKKKKRKGKRKEMAEKEREEEEAKMNDPEEQRRLRLMEEEEAERVERERKEFEERERVWAEMMEKKKKAEEDELRKVLEESNRDEVNKENDDDEDWEYVEEGPAEIIWQGNEIIVKKKRVRVPKKEVDQQTREEDPDRPTSNPLPPQSEAFADYKNPPMASVQQVYDNVSQQVPNFGTEQDKAHCPFHIKTGACRFGQRCSRVHFYPDKSCTLLIKNMYNGPGLAWEQDEGLEVCKWCLHVILTFISRVTLVEVHGFGIGWVGVKDFSNFFLHNIFILGHWSCFAENSCYFPRFELADENTLHTDEEIERCYEEFYEDVHTEFLKFGEIVNFKVCKNGSFHLRGNVCVHYKSLDSAVLAYHSINGRYFAGKQVKCEFIGVTKWKVAICGEYMKSRLKTCSHGTACNFIHCFRNPGGDYEWADWDKPPPRYWMKKMAALFGYSDEPEYEKSIQKESLGWPRNSSRMITAEVDRYRSRRSRSREMDFLKGGSGRSHYDKKDVWKSTRRQRHDSNDRERKIHHEKKFEEKTNFKNNHHSKNRTYGADSDEDWSDKERDRDGDRYQSHRRKSSRHRNKDLEFPDAHGDNKNRTHEADSDGDWSDRDRDTDADRYHSHRRKSSRHRNKDLEFPNEYGDSRTRTHDTDSGGDSLDRDAHHSCKRKSSRHQNKVPRLLDGHGDSKSRTNNTDSSDDWSDRDRERHHSHTRKHSRNWSEVSGVSDDHSDPEKKYRDKFHNRESDREKHSHSSRRDHMSIELSEADALNEGVRANGKCESSILGQYDGRSKSHEVDLRYDSDENIEIRDGWKSGKCISEEKMFRRKETSGGNYDSVNHDRYDGRSHDLDSGYNYDNNSDERGHCESEKSVFYNHHKSRRKYSSDDHEQYSPKSSFHDQKSGEHHDENRSRGSSLSSHGRQINSLEERDSSEEYRESEEKHKKRRRRHRSHGHKRHDKKDDS